MNFNDFSFFSFCWSTWLFVHLELFQLALIMLAAWRLFQKKGKTVTFFFCFCFLLLLPKMPKYHIRTSYTWLEGPSLMLQVLFDTATNISLNADIFQELNWLSKKRKKALCVLPRVRYGIAAVLLAWRGRLHRGSPQLYCSKSLPAQKEKKVFFFCVVLAQVSYCLREEAKTLLV